jgi:hypothetical protein
MMTYSIRIFYGAFQYIQIKTSFSCITSMSQDSRKTLPQKMQAWAWSLFQKWRFRCLASLLALWLPRCFFTTNLSI